MLDASAILAGVKAEPGGEKLAEALEAGVVSAVNVAEVIAGIARWGASEHEARAIWAKLGCEVIAADEDLAIDAGGLRPITDKAGLSLADRFCLALARRLGVPALTADRDWLLVAEEVGVQVELIR